MGSFAPPVGPVFRTIKRRLPIAPRSATLARRLIDELEGDGLSPQMVEDLRLLVSELVTNAVRHGSDGGRAPDPQPAGDPGGVVEREGEELELTMRVGGGRVRVEVTDPGRGFTYEGPTGSYETEGGWGLYLVDQIAERWGIDDQPSTRVWFEVVDRPATVSRVGEAALLDAINAAIVATDPEGIVTHWNDGAEALYGFDRAEAIGQPITALTVDPGDVDAAAAVMDQIREGKAWGGEWLAPRKEGGRVAVWVSNAPVRDSRGRLVGVVGISIDISDRKHAEAELRRSEEHLRVAIDAGAMGTWEWTIAEGRVRWSEALERIHGLQPGTFGERFEDFQRDMHPEDAPDVLGEIRRVVEEGERDYAAEYRIIRPDRETRWLAARARVLRDDDGAAHRLVGVCTDITARKEAEGRLVAQHAVATVLAEAETPEGVAPAILEAIGGTLGWDVGALHVVDADGAALRCVGTWTRDGVSQGAFLEATRSTRWLPGVGLPGIVWERNESMWVEDLADDPRFPRRPLAAREGLHTAVAFPMRLGGEVLGVLEFIGHEIRAPDEALLSLMDGVGNQIGLVVERRRAEEQRTELLEKERVAREAAEEANERLAFLASAGMSFAKSLDFRRTLADLARMCVPRIADWCAIELVEADGSLRQLEVAHVDPERLASAKEFRERYPTPPESPTGVPNVLRTGVPELYPDVTEEMLTASIDDPEQLEFVRQLGLSSVMIVPLVARGRSIGAITFAMSHESGRRFDESDLSFVGHLARRAALSIDNAKLYEERAKIASTLQRSLLPPTLPSIPRVELAAAYQAAAIERNEVGGDFYDAFELGGDTWAISMGDVCGKGVEAAALTGLLRHTLRAEALHARAPSGVLDNLNTSLLRHGTDRFCTVALAFIQPHPAGARVSVACAGHPPPFVLRADGTVEPVGAIGTVLGVLDEVHVEDVRADLAPGDALVLYTDGLIDPRRDNPIDEAGLARLLGTQRGLDAQAIASALSAAVEDPHSAPDDVAVLVARVRPD